MTFTSHAAHPTGPFRARWLRSIKLRMVVVFLLLTVGLALVFIAGAQRAFTLGWREAARPIVMDYVDRLTAEVTAGGSTPLVDRAEQVAQRLPLTVRIVGPQTGRHRHKETDHDDPPAQPPAAQRPGRPRRFPFQPRPTTSRTSST